MTAIADIRRAAKSSTAAATRPSRSTSSWRPATSAAPPCRRAPPPARTRRSSCATATRSAMAARACARRSTRSTARSSMRCRGCDAEDQLAHRQGDDRARRHAQQEPARRQRDPRRVSLAVAKAAAQQAGLPLYRYVGGAARACAAGADDEHHQWRRACRQPDRLPGIHDHAGRRADLRRGRAHGLGGLPRAEEAAERRRARHQCRRRGRLRAQPRRAPTRRWPSS